MSVLTSGLNLYDLAGSSTGNNSALTVSGGQLFVSGHQITSLPVQSFYLFGTGALNHNSVAMTDILTLPFPSWAAGGIRYMLGSAIIYMYSGQNATNAGFALSSGAGQIGFLIEAPIEPFSSFPTTNALDIILSNAAFGNQNNTYYTGNQIVLSQISVGGTGIVGCRLEIQPLL